MFWPVRQPLGLRGTSRGDCARSRRRTALRIVAARGGAVSRRVSEQHDRRIGDVAQVARHGEAMLGKKRRALAPLWPG
jgi:hypothetical protein